MKDLSPKNPLIVIVGETASGKSSLAIEMAERFDGEIICADSRTIYRNMDVGTAKPSAADRMRVQHHLLDVVDPDEVYSAAEFQKHANDAIEQIGGIGRVPFLVGGSGLYVDSVLYDLSFRATADSSLRSVFEAMSVEELQRVINERGYVMPENSRNKRYLVRTLETGGTLPARSELRKNTCVIGLRVEREELYRRISQRTDIMLANGLEAEARCLVAQYGFDAPGLSAPGYREWREYLGGSISLSDVREEIIKNTRRLAKRQRTWFRRNNSIHWVENREEAEGVITTFLNK